MATVILAYRGGTTTEGIEENRGDEIYSFAKYGSISSSYLRTSPTSLNQTASDGVVVVQNGQLVSGPSFPGPSTFAFYRGTIRFSHGRTVWTLEAESHSRLGAALTHSP